jgi:hypothetical protein
MGYNVDAERSGSGERHSIPAVVAEPGRKCRAKRKWSRADNTSAGELRGCSQSARTPAASGENICKIEYRPRNRRLVSRISRAMLDSGERSSVSGAREGGRVVTAKAWAAVALVVFSLLIFTTVHTSPISAGFGPCSALSKTTPKQRQSTMPDLAWSRPVLDRFALDQRVPGKRLVIFRASFDLCSNS